MMAFCQWDYSLPGFPKCVHCGRTVAAKSRTIRRLCSVERPGQLMVFARPAEPTDGPGTRLSELLAGWPLYLTVTPSCPCKKHAAQMDVWGPDECERRLDEIVGWLRDEAASRGLPFVDAVGRILVRRAIAKARLTRPTPS
jgi:hypothetical protein